MSTRELNFRDIAQRLTDAPAEEPAADLWPRIAQAHLVRRQRRRRRRVAAAGFTALALLVVVLMATRVPGPGTTDWQARAQALEIQLHSSATFTGGAENNPLVLDTESELGQVDGALQAAYDHDAGKSELVPLWKQRSELLSALLAARRQSLTVTRI
jgi:hypothetical protein